MLPFASISEFQRASDLANMAHIEALSGHRTEALKTLGQLIEPSKRRYVPAYNIAVVYVALDEKDRAFEWLQKALTERSAGLGIEQNPRLDPLRSDPRFQDLLRRVGLPP